MQYLYNIFTIERKDLHNSNNCLILLYWKKGCTDTIENLLKMWIIYTLI